MSLLNLNLKKKVHIKRTILKNGYLQEIDSLMDFEEYIVPFVGNSGAGKSHYLNDLSLVDNGMGYWIVACQATKLAVGSLLELVQSIYYHSRSIGRPGFRIKNENLGGGFAISKLGKVSHRSMDPDCRNFVTKLQEGKVILLVENFEALELQGETFVHNLKEFEGFGKIIIESNSSCIDMFDEVYTFANISMQEKVEIFCEAQRDGSIIGKRFAENCIEHVGNLLGQDFVENIRNLKVLAKMYRPSLAEFVQSGYDFEASVIRYSPDDLVCKVVDYIVKGTTRYDVGEMDEDEAEDAIKKYHWAFSLGGDYYNVMFNEEAFVEFFQRSS